MPSWRRPLMWPRFSSSEPSHQTMWSGFVRRADSSTQFSSGVDTQPPKADAGTSRGEAARARRTGGAEVLLQKKCRTRDGELQYGARCAIPRANSFLAEGLHWVDARGAMRGDVAGQEGRCHEYGGDGAEGGNVDGADVVEEGVHNATNQVGAAETQRQADRREDHAFAQDQTHHAASACTERHSQADFMGALRYGEGHYPVDSEGSEQERHGGEACEKKRREAITGHGFIDDLVHRLYIGERQIGIHGLGDVGDALAQCGWVADSADGDRCLR